MRSNHYTVFPDAPKARLGDYIMRSTVNNRDEKYGIELIEGVTNEGVFASPKGNPLDVDLKPYKIVNNGAFVYNPSRLNLGSIAYRTGGLCIVSHLYIVFYLNEEGKKRIDPDWLFMYFRRDEFYREVTFRNFGSQRPEFNFNDMSDIMIPLPDIAVQQKYVAIYKAMVANQQSYERGLEDLKLALDAYVENARRENQTTAGRSFLLGDLIEQRREKYDGSEMPIRGVSKEGFVEPRQPDADLGLYNQYYYNDFVFNPARMELNSIQLNSYFEKACCSSLYEIFYVKRLDVVMPEYLNLLLKRKEFARWCEYVGWGSAREYCRVDTISQYPIVVPSLDEQKSVVDIYKAYMLRKQINEQLKTQIKDICPILIRGSLEEVK